MDGEKDNIPHGHDNFRFEGTHQGQGTYNFKTTSSNAVKGSTHRNTYITQIAHKCFFRFFYIILLLILGVKNTQNSENISEVRGGNIHNVLRNIRMHVFRILFVGKNA